MCLETASDHALRTIVNPFIKKHPELFSTDPPRPAYKRGAPTEMKIGLSSYAKGRLMSSKMKRMLVTQPPLAWIRFARTQGALRYPCGSQIAWYNEDHMSVTMQQLATEVPLGDNLEFLGGEHFEELACAADLEALRSSENFN